MSPIWETLELKEDDEGAILLNILLQYNLFLYTVSFKKTQDETWEGPNGKTRNEVDYSMIDKRQIVQNESVLHKVHQ